MKRCPQCRRDYYDDSLLFCLDDGSALLDGPGSVDEPVTAILGARPTGSSERPTEQFVSGAPEIDSGNVVVSTSKRARTLVMVVATVVVLAVAGFAGFRYFNRGASSRINSIAVLPFENRSGSADTDYLSDGLTDSLIFRFSQLPDLKVSPT